MGKQKNSKSNRMPQTKKKLAKGRRRVMRETKKPSIIVIQSSEVEEFEEELSQFKKSKEISQEKIPILSFLQNKINQQQAQTPLSEQQNVCPETIHFQKHSNEANSPICENKVESPPKPINLPVQESFPLSGFCVINQFFCPCSNKFHDYQKNPLIKIQTPSFSFYPPHSFMMPERDIFGKANEKEGKPEQKHEVRRKEKQFRTMEQTKKSIIPICCDLENRSFFVQISDCEMSVLNHYSNFLNEIINQSDKRFDRIFVKFLKKHYQNDNEIEGRKIFFSHVRRFLSNVHEEFTKQMNQIEEISAEERKYRKAMRTLFYFYLRNYIIFRPKNVEGRQFCEFARRCRKMTQKLKYFEWKSVKRRMKK